MMTESQIKLMQQLLTENERLGQQLDIAIEALNKCVDNGIVGKFAAQALQQIIKIGSNND